MTKKFDFYDLENILFFLFNSIIFIFWFKIEIGNYNYINHANFSIYFKLWIIIVYGGSTFISVSKYLNNTKSGSLIV